ncbi:hypothetical protein XELAEV_18035026mg [Xenopus laevis]|uniref:Uncharacterized protein n=1 Tax=Xenopus laevis TaxID=8355 RepID=A0A974HBR5_XENLA|nr:hypothetical protein XELAEV_18035026mg [Xenopus laevis]
MAPLSDKNGAQCKQWDVLFGSQFHCWLTDKVIPEASIGQRASEGGGGAAGGPGTCSLSRAPWSVRLGCHGYHQVLESMMDGHLHLPHLCMDLGHPPHYSEFLAALLMVHRLYGSHHCVDEPRLRCRSITQSPSFLLWLSPNCCSWSSSTTYKKKK